MAKAKKTKKQKDSSAEERIKLAARTVFHRKGYAAARTRDIAEEAGMNLALLNYYFRSKKKLFDLIMLETVQEFFLSLATVFNDEESKLETKVELIAHKYIDLLLEEPEIPIFLLSELRSQEPTLLKQLDIRKVLSNSVLFRQWKEAAKANKVPPMHPLQFMVNLMSLVIFPFIGSPIIKTVGNMKQEEFDRMMTERKTLIPKWIKAIMKTT
jgi:AcrR family transcriptional regulator